MRVCCLCKKKVQANSGAFFKVPSDERRKKQWSDICGMQFKKQARICADHFVASHIIKGTRRDGLMPCAVPCLQLFVEERIPIPYTDASSATSSNNNICPQEFFDISMGAPKVVPSPVVRYKEAQTQTKTTILQIQLERYQNMNDNLQAEIKDLKSQLDAKNKAIGFMRTIFTGGQIKNIMNPGDVHWGRNDVSNAIRLHSSGPKAYNYMLKKGYPLPPVSTLEFWCRKVVVSEGFQTTSLGFMKHCTELTSEDKICVLAFDRMEVVNDNNSVNDSNRKQVGYVQVVVAQGLWKSWKRPVFFDFEREMKKDVLCSVIAELNKAKFPVVAVVSDLKPNNRQLWQDLGVTTDKPWFPNPVNTQEKVFAFADPPQLLEKLRNQFLDTGLLWDNELLTSRTIADAIKQTLNSNTSITFDLTDEHLSNKSEEGETLAAQLFSITTENSLRRCYAIGVNLSNLIEIADLIQLISDWYDTMNSTIDSFTITGKQPFGIVLADQQGILRRMNKFMSTPIIPNKTTLENFQDGVRMTNTAVVMLHEYIKQKYGVTYVLTSRINQHELKHLVGAIHSKGGSDDHLTPNEFKNRLRKYIFAQNLMHLHGTEKLENISSSNAMADSKNVSNQKVTNDSNAKHRLQHHVLDKFVADRKPSNGNLATNTSDSSSTRNTLVKIVSNHKVTDEIKPNGVNKHEVLHEIITDRDPEVLDELNTANEDDVGNFVEDALKYISGCTYSE